MSEVLRCAVCRAANPDRAHVRTRGAGAGWEEWEFLPLCRFHHIKQGQLGWWKFVHRFPWVMKALEERGWRWIEQVGKKVLWNDKLEGKNENE